MNVYSLDSACSVCYSNKVFFENENRDRRNRKTDVCRQKSLYCGKQDTLIGEFGYHFVILEIFHQMRKKGLSLKNPSQILSQIFKTYYSGIEIFKLYDEMIVRGSTVEAVRSSLIDALVLSNEIERGQRLYWQFGYRVSFTHSGSINCRNMSDGRAFLTVLTYVLEEDPNHFTVSTNKGMRKRNYPFSAMANFIAKLSRLFLTRYDAKENLKINGELCFTLKSSFHNDASA